ncbi:MAG: DUF262 domain-containing protein [Chitinophagaceae bacterium]|nr:DUF262 domain-containing protein [Anaerolineae bacterium]
MSLLKEIDKMRQEIRTDGYPMSISEWISLYENNEIDIHPEFQRFYRWQKEQKTKLIESILLGIPIPPIFVSQRQDGVWDVVDGLQRLSTILEFVGILKNENNELITPLVLDKTDYLPSLEGKKWDDKDDKENSFTTEERLLVKRSKISASILLRESDEVAKYELFQRLNTGGSTLTDQEVRNCILVMVNRNMYQWLLELSKYDKFQEIICLSERPLQEQYDIELALRFVVFSTIEEAELVSLGDVGKFLTQKMVSIAKNKTFNFEEMKSRFIRTFDLLSRTTGENSFKRFSKEKNRFLGGFFLSPFEVITFGLGNNIDTPPADERIEGLIKSIWENEIFKAWSGSGMTATRRLPKLIPLGREVFRG